MEFLGTPDIGPLMFVGLTAASFATAFLGVFTGTAGGVILLAFMAMVMPPTLLVPIHTVVQLGSGVSRTIIMWRYVMRSTLPPFMIGAVLGAAVGANTFVALPANLLLGIIGAFILIVTWLPQLGRMGAEKSRFGVLGFLATFIGVFVSATGTFIVPFVASVAPDRLNQVATQGALMISVHVAKLAAFSFLGFEIGAYLPLMAAMVLTGAGGNWLGEVCLAKTQERRFRLILRLFLTLLACQLLFRAIANSVPYAFFAGQLKLGDSLGRLGLNICTRCDALG